jgi:hypothetical protein
MRIDGFDGLAEHMRKAAAKLPKAIEKELDTQGALILTEIKAKFGTYQAGWPQLAEVTQEQRTKLGFSPNDPLFRSGDLRDAVKAERTDFKLFIGIKDGAVTLEAPGSKPVDAALVLGVHESGTTDGRVPARPVFGPVVFHIAIYAYPLVRGVLKRVGL